MNQPLSLFQQKGKAAQRPATPLGTLMSNLNQKITASPGTYHNDTFGAAAVSMESMDSGIAQELSAYTRDLSGALESLIEQAFPDVLDATGKAVSRPSKDFGKSHRAAAIAAGVLASNPKAALGAAVQPSVSMESGKFAFIAPDAFGGAVSFEKRSVSLEAYDERENKNVVLYSVAFNLNASRQDAMGEALYPTVLVTPDQFGYTVSIQLIRVYKDIKYGIGAQVEDWQFRNLVDAVVDHTVLENDVTDLVPVFRDENKGNFVPEALLTPIDTTVDKEPIKTSALAIGKKIPLIPISSTDALLAAGAMDTTDAVEPSINLKNLYVQIGSGATAEVFRFGTMHLPYVQFNEALQGNYRKMVLNFETNELLIDEKKKRAGGQATTILAVIGTEKYEVRLSVSVSGSVNLQSSETQLITGEVSVSSILDVDGNVIPLEGTVGQQIVTLFADAKVIGYDLDARRVNSNRRQRGTLVDTTFDYQIYGVNLQGPITILHPVSLQDANDSTDMATLITTCRIRTSNAAVTEVLRAASVLEEFVGQHAATSENPPQILGAARFLVRPYHRYRKIDVSEGLDSLVAHKRAEDVQAHLVNLLRDTAYDMYVQSRYKAAADLLSGGQSQVPTVIIATDQYISRYLLVDGDLRTLGADFFVKIVHTQDLRMRGKIIMTFGQFGEGTEGVPNIMHFGNMAWKPEIVSVLQVSRNNQVSREVTVQPSFRHVTNLPVMAVFDIEGIDKVVAQKINVNTFEKNPDMQP